MPELTPKEKRDLEYQRAKAQKDAERAEEQARLDRQDPLSKNYVPPSERNKGNAYQDYVNATAASSPTVVIQPQNNPTGTLNAGNRAAYIDAIQNGYKGSYEQFIADRRAGRVR